MSTADESQELIPLIENIRQTEVCQYSQNEQCQLTDFLYKVTKCAIESNKPSLVTRVLQLGHTAIHNHDSQPLTLMAIEHCRDEIIDIFLKFDIQFNDVATIKTDINCSEDVPEVNLVGNALHLCAKFGNGCIMGKLLQSGLDPNVQTYPKKWTPLMMSLIYENDDMIPVLLEHGADVNAVDETDGRGALHYSAIFRSPDTIRRLLTAGADVTTQDRHDKTPITYSILHYHDMADSDVIASMLDVCPQAIASRFSQKETYLHWACSVGRVRGVIDTLLDRGGDINARDVNGDTPFMNAVLNNRADAVRYLQTRCGGEIEVNAVNHSGERALGHALVTACQRMDENTHSILNTVKELGSDINGKHSDHRPYIFTCLTGDTNNFHRTNAVRWILANGVDTSPVMSDGETALHCAVRSVGEGKDVEIVQMLLHCNYDMRLSNLVHTKSETWDNMTPLQLALSNGNVMLSYLLFHSGAALNNGMAAMMKTSRFIEVRQHPEIEKLSQLILAACSTPLLLKQIARLNVLGNMRTMTVTSVVSQLDIPEELHTYLSLNGYQTASQSNTHFVRL